MTMKRNRLIVGSWLLLTAFFARAQVVVMPPSRTDGRGAVYAFNALKAGAYRYTTGGIQITVRFRVTEMGTLDTVRVTADTGEELPVAYLAAIEQKLRSLDGQWLPQRRNGIAERSYWLVAHYYLVREGSISPAMKATSAAYSAQYNEELKVFEQQRPKQRSVQTDGCFFDGDTWLVAPYAFAWISCSRVN